jgi:hypothetical protein
VTDPHEQERARLAAERARLAAESAAEEAMAEAVAGAGPSQGLRRSFRYPTDHLLAVVDRPADGPSVVAAIVSLGVAAADVEAIAGDGADDRLDLLAKDSVIQRAMTAVRFMTMDQAPDFALYLAALRDGRAVVAVHVPETALRGRVVERLNALGAHFLNFYGRVATEEITRWRGEELPLPGWLRR